MLFENSSSSYFVLDKYFQLTAYLLFISITQKLTNTVKPALINRPSAYRDHRL